MINVICAVVLSEQSNHTNIGDTDAVRQHCDRDQSESS